jgi:hypothetical protein
MRRTRHSSADASTTALIREMLQNILMQIKRFGRRSAGTEFRKPIYGRAQVDLVQNFF